MRLLLDTHAFLWWVADDPALSPAARNAVAAPANLVHVSAATAWEITPNYRIGTLPGLGRFDGRQIASLVGVAPVNRGSATFRDRRIVMGGRAVVRKALYMPTVTAIRHNPALKALYVRLTGRGKHAKVALTAAMRKLLTILMSQTPWQHA